MTEIAINLCASVHTCVQSGHQLTRKFSPVQSACFVLVVDNYDHKLEGSAWSGSNPPFPRASSLLWATNSAFSELIHTASIL